MVVVQEVDIGYHSLRRKLIDNIKNKYDKELLYVPKGFNADVQAYVYDASHDWLENLLAEMLTFYVQNCRLLFCHFTVSP